MISLVATPFLEREPQGLQSVVCLGRLSISESNALRSELRRLIDHGQNIGLDLSGITELDSAGLATIVAAFADARNAGVDFCLTGISEIVVDIMQLYRLGNLISLSDPTYGKGDHGQ